MSESTANHRNARRHRAVLISVALLAVFAAGGLGLGVFAKISDMADRAH